MASKHRSGPPPISQFAPKDRSTGERLQKVLASSGLASRRACEELITTGRVTVDGKTVTELGTRVDLATQKVCVDGEVVRSAKPKYWVIYKPAGTLCTNNDPGGRPRVIDLIPASEGRLFTVGRLDENTEGLLLLTNDGELAQRMAHPRYQIRRTYRALVAGVPTDEDLDSLRRGLYFTDGKFRVHEISVVKRQGNASICELVMLEGQNREVRRLLARIDHKVMKLKRIAFGPLKLGDLEPGEYRALLPKEIDGLKKLVSGKYDPAESSTPVRPRPARGVKKPFRKTSESSTAAPRKRVRFEKTRAESTSGAEEILISDYIEAPSSAPPKKSLRLTKRLTEESGPKQRLESASHSEPKKKPFEKSGKRPAKGAKSSAPPARKPGKKTFVKKRPR